MQWSEVALDYIERLKPIAPTKNILAKIFSLLDLTSLNETDTEAVMAPFFAKATYAGTSVAAVCIYPPFVRMAVSQFSGTLIKVATVANFPAGTSTLESVLIEINQALRDGAEEIDVVFPYERY